MTTDQLDKLMERAMILEAQIQTQIASLDKDGIETINLG